MRKLHWIILFLIMTQLGTGCTSISTNTSTATPTAFQKQPESHSPIIKGQFSGLSGDVLITTHIQTLSGREVQWGTRRGNGAWESVISNHPDMDYTVTAEAEGYTSTPSSYTIHVNGEAAFLRVDAPGFPFRSCRCNYAREVKSRLDHNQGISEHRPRVWGQATLLPG